MKDSLLLPVIFLALLLACLALFTIGFLIFHWDLQYVPSAPPTLAWAVREAPAAIVATALPAILSALFLTLARLARRPGIPALSLLLLFLSAASALYWGAPSLEHYLPARSPGLRSDPLVAGRFNVTDSRVIFPQSVSGDRLGASLVVDPSSTPAFTMAASGRFDPSTWAVSFDEPTLSVPVVPRNPTLSAEVAPRGFLAGLLRDMATMKAFLATVEKGATLDHAITVGGIVLFSVACAAVAWLTRWPVINLGLVILSFRGVFWLFALFSTKIAANAFALVLPASLSSVAPALGLAGVGVLLMIWTILFIRPRVRR